MSTSVIARIAKIVPLAVVAAIGAAACTSPEAGSQAAPTAARSAAPAVSAPASPAATPVAPAPSAPVTSTPTSEPTTAAAAAPVAAQTSKAQTSKAQTSKAKAPAAKSAQGGTGTGTGTAAAPAAERKPASAGGIGITFDGLSEGRRIQVGDKVSFSVTWKNNDSTGSRQVAPVVATQPFEGAQCYQTLAMAKGTLERKDASGWKALPTLSQGGGMDYAGTGDDAAFTLAAGESRTVEYRMVLDAGNQPGQLAVEADAVVPHSFKTMAKSVVNAAVVDSHRPVVTSVSTPTELVVGKTPTEFSFKVSSPDGSGLLRPVVRLALPTGEGLSGQDVTIEAKVRDEWKSFEVTPDCNGLLGVAPSQLVGVMKGNPVEYTFRVGLKRTADAGPVEIQVGGDSDGHTGAVTTVRPAVRR
ncbi:hypothetical protein [Kitasatospora sp. NPDC056531]|uniref:hypothetical protein n=1 Tax=Kitasatospora sp. NPDC056531 TaxID=3345856 RepID=UPI00369A3D36